MLEGVEVLRLVDEEMAKPPVDERPERLVGLDGAQVEVEQIVEVDDTAATLQPFVRAGQLEEPSGRYHTPATCRTRLALVVGRRDATGPCPIDVGHRRIGIELEPQLLQALAHQPCAVGGERRHRLVTSQGPVAQQSQGDAVERAGFDRFVDLEAPQSAAQLAGSITGERQGRDVTRFGVTSFDSVGDPAGQHGGLSRACRGDDCQRRGVALDGATLVGIEAHQ